MTDEPCTSKRLLDGKFARVIKQRVVSEREPQPGSCWGFMLPTQERRLGKGGFVRFTRCLVQPTVHSAAKTAGGHLLASFLVAVVAYAFGTVRPESAHAIALTPIATGFNNPIGIDHHKPTNKLVLSVNYPSGTPINFELVAADGTRSPFSTVSGLTDEIKIATARDTLGGFVPGELFTGTGISGEIARISPDGSVVQSPWVTLPDEDGLMRGGLHVDRTGVFGGDLIVATTTGGIWRVTSSGTATLVVDLNTCLEGVTTVPDDPAKYGAWAGTILVGSGLGTATNCPCGLYAIDPQGNATLFDSLGVCPEDIDIIPTNETFYGVAHTDQAIYAALPTEFTSMVGDVLITQEEPGYLWHVRWDGSQFQVDLIAQVTHWEHVTFSTARVLPLEVCNNCLDDDNDGAIDLLDSDCSSSALALKKGAIKLGRDGAEDKLVLRGSFSLSANAIDPPAAGVTINLQDADGLVACVAIPPGASWSSNTRVPRWSFRDAKDGSSGDPLTNEQVKLRFSKRKSQFGISIRVKDVEVLDPDAADLTASVVVGENAFLNTQPWRVRGKRGTRIITP